MKALSAGKAIDTVRSDTAWRRRHLDQLALARPAIAEDAEEAALAGVGTAELREALNALPKAEHVAIEMAFFGGYSYREVAAALGVPEGTIKSRIRAELLRLEMPQRRAGRAPWNPTATDAPDRRASIL